MPTKTEIVPQTKLTSLERLALIEGSNNGGVCKRFEGNARHNLQFLGLIEERSKWDAAAKKDQQTKLDLNWKAALQGVRARDRHAVDKAMSEISSIDYHKDDTAWFLTPAAQEYLLNGRVIVTVSTAKPKKVSEV